MKREILLDPVLMLRRLGRDKQVRSIAFAGLAVVDVLQTRRCLRLLVGNDAFVMLVEDIPHPKLSVAGKIDSAAGDAANGHADDFQVDFFLGVRDRRIESMSAAGEGGEPLGIQALFGRDEPGVKVGGRQPRIVTHCTVAIVSRTKRGRRRYFQELASVHHHLRFRTTR